MPKFSCTVLHSGVGHKQRPPLMGSAGNGDDNTDTATHAPHDARVVDRGAQLLDLAVDVAEVRRVTQARAQLLGHTVR
jgi:hypothetical protein